MAASALSGSLSSLWNKLQEKSAFVESPTPRFDLPKLTQLNETVYRAYQPRPEEKPELELVFFHGIQFQDCKEPHATTWMTRDNSECWLQTLLVEAFPRARIFTVSYDSSAAKTSKVGRMGMYLTGENLLSDLTADEVGLGQAGCPVVLVGHCLGGLVLKEICLFAEKACRRKTGKPLEQRARALYSNLRGMFFYGTPHTGSMVGDMLQDCFKSVGALSEEIETLQASSTRRNESFMELKSENKWFLYGIGESMETYVPCIGSYIHISSEGSTRAYMDGYYTSPGDHYEICKLEGKTDSAFQRLCELLRKIQDDDSVQRQADVNAALDYYVDKQGRSQKVQEMLAQADTYAIFIVGLSGSGKTALAQQVFHEIRNSYEVPFCVSLERIESTSTARHDTLRKIGQELGEADRGSRGNLASIIRHFRHRKGLLVLDNVETQAQLDALCIQTWQLSSSSRIIVTTTNPSCIAPTIPWVRSPLKTFEVPLLSYPESVDLFSHYAFGNGYGPEDLVDCIQQVIVKCDAYPSFLKILGACISKRKFGDKKLWLDLVTRLEDAEEVNAGRDEKLWAKLRLCYEDLQPSEKQMFLDISTVLYGYPLPLLRCIWKDCRRASHLALQNLQEQFLVFEDALGNIRMHQHLRNLGKSIACPQGIAIEKWQRISESSTATELINYHEGRVETLALKIHLLENEFFTLRRKSFENFIRLQYLILKDVSLQGVTLELPRSLVYLRWENGLFDVCPVDFTHLEKLAVLEFVDCKLLKSLPPDVAKARKLTWLELKGCASLTELPGPLCDCLEHLGLNGTGLRRLPGDVWKLRRLRCLKARDTQLKRVSRRLCGLENLRELDLQGTQLTSLPESFGDLKSLEKLNLKGTKLCSLPDSVGRLQNLVSLHLNQTPMEKLPNSLCSLHSLRELALYETQLTTLPCNIGELVGLTFLSLSSSKWNGYPESFGKLSGLEDCTIAAFPLKRVDSVGGDSGDETVLDEGDGQPGLGQDSFISALCGLQATRILSLVGTGFPQESLEALFCALQHMPSLSELWLEDFDLPERIPPNLGKLASLSELVLERWTRLTELPECLSELPKLEKLRLFDLPLVRNLPESSSASALCSGTPRGARPLGPSIDSVDTDSWSIVEYFLECCGKLHSEHIMYHVERRVWEEAMKMAAEKGPGHASRLGDVLGSNMARELFPEIGLSQCGRNGVGASTPAACHTFGGQTQRLYILEEYGQTSELQVVDFHGEQDGSEEDSEATDEDSEDSSSQASD